MKTKHLPTAATLAAAMAASLFVAACNPAAEPRATGPDATETRTAARSVSASDPAITLAIKTALARDDSLSALRIDVDTVNGNVTLNGSAPNADARQRATALARHIDGVKSVDNRLELPPTS